MFVSVDLIGEKNQVILELTIMYSALITVNTYKRIALQSVPASDATIHAHTRGSGTRPSAISKSSPRSITDI